MSEPEFMWKPAVAKLLQKHPNIEMSIDEILSTLFKEYPDHWRLKRARYTKQYTDAEFYRKERGILTSTFTHKNRKIISELYPKIELITENNTTQTLKAMVWREKTIRDYQSIESNQCTVTNAELLTKLNQMQHTLGYVLQKSNSINPNTEAIRRLANAELWRWLVTIAGLALLVVLRCS